MLYCRFGLRPGVQRRILDICINFPWLSLYGIAPGVITAIQMVGFFACKKYSNLGRRKPNAVITVLCMKRSVQKDTNFSVKHRAEFLCFVFNFSILKTKFKNLAVFANNYEPFGLAVISYVLYTVLCFRSLFSVLIVALTKGRLFDKFWFWWLAFRATWQCV